MFLGQWQEEWTNKEIFLRQALRVAPCLVAA
jgi:hypothetical protein